MSKKGVVQEVLEKLRVYNVERVRNNMYCKSRKALFRNGKYNQLTIILAGYELIISSYDVRQLERLKVLLNKRETESVLLKDFCDDDKSKHFNLTPQDKDFLRFERELKCKIDTACKHLDLDDGMLREDAIIDINFFTNEEQELMKKWY